MLSYMTYTRICRVCSTHVCQSVWSTLPSDPVMTQFWSYIPGRYQKHMLQALPRHQQRRLSLRKRMQVMVPQPVTAAQARWKSPNQLCKLLMHNLLLLRSSCMHCAGPLVLSLFDGFCPLGRCVCSSLMSCSCSVGHFVPDMQTVFLGAFVSMVHAVRCQ